MIVLQKKKWLFLFSITALLLSCEKSKEDLGSSDSEGKIPILLEVSPFSRVSENSFETNDEIGIFVVNNPDGELGLSGNQVDNMRFTYSEGKWAPDNEIYWKDKNTSADFYCYFPYTGSISSIGEHSFSIKNDQSSEMNYKYSEFLWGKKESVFPTSSAVTINVKHLMSKLVISLKPGDGYNSEDLIEANVSICNVKTDAYINLENGNVSVANGDNVKIIPQKVDDGYTALLVPQNVDNMEFIEVDIDGIKYTLTTSVNLESGKIHNCTVTISKKSGGINVGIDGWETDDIDYGGMAN